MAARKVSQRLARSDNVRKYVDELLKRRDISIDVRALLLLIRIEILDFDFEVVTTCQRVLDLIDGVEPLTKVRIQTALGRYFSRTGGKEQAKSYFEGALKIVRTHNLTGEEPAIEAMLR